MRKRVILGFFGIRLIVATLGANQPSLIRSGTVARARQRDRFGRRASVFIEQRDDTIRISRAYCPEKAGDIELIIASRLRVKGRQLRP